MKRLLFGAAAIFFFSTGICFSQTDQWVWMKGDSVPGNSFSDADSFGQKGVFSDTAMIPKLYGACNWSIGNRFFVLGGCYYSAADGFALGMNAMWEYRMDSNQWAWVGGDGSFGELPVYGEQGVADANNFPGHKVNAAYWTDKEGNFWLFGGLASLNNNYQMNNLWKYDITTGWWTWMKGSNLYDPDWHYGIKGVEDSLNNPPPRCQSENWIDMDGNLWLFGGLRAGAGVQYKNDLWRYNIATNNWTWMKGDTGWNKPGVYGTLGVPDPANKPGGRINNRLHWVDTLGNLYLFGGWTLYPLQGYYYDLWKYSVSTNEWTWINGTGQVNSGGLSINLCGNSNIIASRAESTGWIDKQGYFWLIGGETNFENPNYVSGTNDMWKYDPYHNEWWWIGGNNVDQSPGSYGVQGEPDMNNEIRSRHGAVSWVDSLNNFWIWGGAYLKIIDVDYCLNDLWRYTPDSSCGVYTGTDGFFEVEKDGITITPNPASASINIVYSIDQNATLTFINTFGSVVKQLTLYPNFKNRLVDVNDLAAGVYLITLHNENKIISRKIVVER